MSTLNVRLTLIIVMLNILKHKWNIYVCFLKKRNLIRNLYIINIPYPLFSKKMIFILYRHYLFSPKYTYST